MASAESGVTAPRTAASASSCTMAMICSISGTGGAGRTRSSCERNARMRGSAASAESAHASRRAGRSPARWKKRACYSGRDRNSIQRQASAGCFDAAKSTRLDPPAVE